jgi:hypothetical protein
MMVQIYIFLISILDGRWVVSFILQQLKPPYELDTRTWETKNLVDMKIRILYAPTEFGNNYDFQIIT